MKKVIIAIVFSFLFFSVYSQSCLSEGITFSTQAQIDSFQINHPSCTEIEGDVIIGGDNITNLNGLNVITTFWSDLMIGNDEYYKLGFNGFNLEGLNNVVHIGGNLLIAGCDSLLNLEGLENLISIGGNLVLGKSTALTAFIYNPKLNSLSGLNKLSTIGGGMSIILTSLTDLSGLESLTSISGDFGIIWNFILTNLSGLSNVTSLGGNLYLAGNELISLTGLEGLTSVFGNVTFMYNDNLSDFTGLNNLTSVVGELSIYSNAGLTSLSGLENIDAGSISDLSIHNNHSLADCEVQSICKFLAAPNGTIEIHGNAPGCNSPEEVKDSCEAHAGIIDTRISKELVFLYPNPAYQELKISTEGFTINEVRIYTLTGQQIMKGRPVNEKVDISHLQSGMYIVEVRVENTMIRRKLLIE